MTRADDIKEQLTAAYDTDVIRRNNKERSGWKAAVRDTLVAHLQQEDKKTILEIGTGTGIDARFFVANGFDVLATDLSPKMVEACRTTGLAAEVCDLYDIARLGRTFDAVYSMNVMLHVPPEDLDRVLGHIHSVLKDNGLFFYGVYGGVTKQETVTDSTRMNLPRYFSFLSDAVLLEAAQKHFLVVDYQKIDIGNEQAGLHFQSLLLRKK